jgi:hypothetical protein
MVDKQRLTIDVQDKDREWMKKHLEDVDHLVGLVQEMFGKETQCLLSPLFRRLMLEHADKVAEQRNKLVARELFLDNPGEPLS